MATNRSKIQTGPGITLGIPTGYMVLLFAAPILVFLIYSFWQMDGFRIVQQWTLKNYIEVARTRCTSR